jgi:hypothetical protein
MPGTHIKSLQINDLQAFFSFNVMPKCSKIPNMLVSSSVSSWKQKKVLTELAVTFCL